MIKELSSSVSRADVLTNHNECIIHFIDVQSLTLARMYLKLAWSEKSIGANHLYLVYMGDMTKFELRFNDLFDFKRLILATSEVVGFLHFQLNYKQANMVIYNICSRTSLRSVNLMSFLGVKEI